MSKINELIIKWRKLPETIRRGEVKAIGRKLGLGSRSLDTWMAHECPRARVGRQWRYARDAVISALLDKAGVLEHAGKSSVGAGGISEGVPGSQSLNLR